MRAYTFVTATALCALSLVATGSAQKTTGPKATYEMDVSTNSGMGMGMMMGGGLGSILGGGGGDANYSLEMWLKSSITSPKQPETGDHFFTPSAKMGKSVPLLGGVPGGTRQTDRDPTDEDLRQGKPKGRLLMFWGCHEKAPKGQPFIIDFSKMPTYKLPAEARMERNPRAKPRDENAAWWPNDKNGKQPKSGSSLRGEHRVTSIFTPEIKYNLVNDYMAALNVNAGDRGAAIGLGWNSVPTATGYSAWAVGGMERAGEGGDMVFWNSANNRDQTMGMGRLSPAEVQRQIGLRNIMPPSQTTCTIPAEAKAAAGGMMFGGMQAYGPEENFAFPPKPADPKAVWNIEWTAKARFQSLASFMTGMGEGGMMGSRGSDVPPSEPKKKKPCKGPFGVPIPGTSC
jgi:hypothetical protein